MTTSSATAAKLAALLLAVGLGAAGCGDDEPNPPPPKPAKAAKDPAAKGGAKKAAGPAIVGSKKKAKKPKKMALEVYPRIDDRYRAELKESDFLPDPTGEERRDPFQSFVIRQGGGRLAATAAPVQPTDVCTAKNSRAVGYALRDMRLIGIVLRGTASTAQFRDGRGFGWIVRRGDCLGKEKAVVQSIGVGSVTLEVIPETPPNAPPPPPQRQDIALYPDDLDTGAALGEDIAPPPPAPPPTSPSTPTGTPPSTR